MQLSPIEKLLKSKEELHQLVTQLKNQQQALNWLVLFQTCPEINLKEAYLELQIKSQLEAYLVIPALQQALPMALALSMER